MCSACSHVTKLCTVAFSVTYELQLQQVSGLESLCWKIHTGFSELSLICVFEDCLDQNQPPCQKKSNEANKNLTH